MATTQYPEAQFREELRDLIKKDHHGQVTPHSLEVNSTSTLNSGAALKEMAPDPSAILLLGLSLIAIGLIRKIRSGRLF